MTIKIDTHTILKSAKRVSVYYATGYIKEIYEHVYKYDGDNDNYSLKILRDKPKNGRYKFCRIKIEQIDDVTFIDSERIEE